MLGAELLEPKLAMAVDVPNSGFPGGFVVAGNLAFFAATDAVHGCELWRTDGTSKGTWIVADVRPGADSSYPESLTAAGSRLFFCTTDWSNPGRPVPELWVTNGTQSGAEMVTRFQPYASVSGLTVVNDVLVFKIWGGSTQSLWISDGSELGTFEIFTAPAATSLSEPVMLNGRLVFTVTREAGGNGDEGSMQIWTSDGSAVTTKLAATVTGVSESRLAKGLAFKGQIFFTAGDEAGAELWVTDATGAGTRRVKDIYPGTYTYSYGASSYTAPRASSPDGYTAVGNTVYFTADSADGRELWKTDGTSARTVLVKDIAPGTVKNAYTGAIEPRGSFPSALTALGDALFFAADDGSNGTELWRTDGTSTGTRLVKDLAAGMVFDADAKAQVPRSSYPGKLAPYKGSLYFLANDNQLWKTDGTAQGTGVVRPLNAANNDAEGSSGSYGSMAILNGKLLFGADDGSSGNELWQSDGTTTGTSLLANIFPETKYMALSSVVSSLPERPVSATRTKVADIINATGLVAGTLSLAGADADKFETDGKSLFLKSTASLDFEAKNVCSVAVKNNDSTLPSGPSYQCSYVLSVTDVNEAPTKIALVPIVSSLRENTGIPQPLKVATIAVTDDALGSNAITLTGPDAALFKVDGLSLFLRSSVSLDYESKSALVVGVSVVDRSISGSSPATAAYTLRVTDVNEPPTKVTLVNVISKLSEKSPTAQRVKVTDVTVVDDATGANQITLSGPDAGFFQVDGKSVYLKAGTKFNAKAKASYAISIRVSDPSLPGTIPVVTAFKLAVTRAT